MAKEYKCPCCGYVQKCSYLSYDFRCPVCRTDGVLFIEMKETETSMPEIETHPQSKHFGKKTLTLDECKEYIRNIRDLEISCYQLEKLQKGLENELRKAEVKKRELSAEKIEEPSQDSIIKDFFLSIAAGLYYGTVPGIVLGFIFGITSVDKFFRLALTLIGIFSGIIAAFLFINSLIESRNYKRTNLEKQKKYETDKRCHEQNVNRNNISLQCIPAEIKKCNEEYKKTKDLLQQYYSLNYIYPKYRGMVPIYTICEYLESGLCFSLLGHEGAYNLYESELHMNLIIEKLDDIIYRLDDIQTSQRMLVREIKRSNAMIDSLCKSMENIAENTALTQYYSKITATNTSYLAWLAYLNQNSDIL